MLVHSLVPTTPVNHKFIMDWPIGYYWVSTTFSLYSRIFDTREAMLEGAIEIATLIASKSPIAVQTSKASLVYSRDHSVPEGLNDVVRFKSICKKNKFYNDKNWLKRELQVK